MSISFKGCLSEQTELSIHFESFNNECALVKEAQDVNLLSQESKLTRVIWENENSFASWKKQNDNQTL